MAANNDTLQELHAAVAVALTGIVSAEEPSAAHLSAAIAFLKNNNVTADANSNKELAELGQALAAKRRKPISAAAIAEAEADWAQRNPVGGMQ